MTLLTMFRKNKQFWVMAGALLTAVTVITVIILMIAFLSGNDKNVKAAVVTNGVGCAKIGTDIMEQGGNVVDAAIAALLCEGVSMPQSMGLGGGFLLTLYKKSTGEVVSLNSREVAPAAATRDMFNNNPQASQKGGLAVAVPGELIGYWALYTKYGGDLPWKSLIQPTIDLCRNGIYITNYLAEKINYCKETLFADPVLREIFIDPKTNDTYKEGQYVKRLKLAKTLEIISDEGGMALNNGSLTESFVNDIRANGGIITVEDMKSYSPQWQKPIQVSLLEKTTLYSAPLPGSGVVLGFIMNILEGFLNINNPNSVTNYQRLVESLKFGYGMRSRLGDADFEPLSEIVANLTSKEYAKEIRALIFDNMTFSDPAHYGAVTALPSDYGTAHLSLLAPNGDAVSVTSTINAYFGAGFASSSTGIILNNEMDDFSSPNMSNIYNIAPSPENFIEAGKRPLSSMCPSIILDENKNVILIVGAAGGSKITTTVSQIIINHLWFGSDLKTAMDDGRLHHQLIPMILSAEQEFSKQHPTLLEALKKIGHTYQVSGPSDGFSAATAISNYTDSLLGKFDIRRSGSVSYIR